METQKQDNKAKIMLLSKMKKVRILLKILNKCYPAVLLDSHFYAFMDVNGWWIFCTDYWVYKDKDFQKLCRDIRQAAAEDGFPVDVRLSTPVGAMMDKKNCANLNKPYLALSCVKNEAASEA